MTRVLLRIMAAALLLAVSGLIGWRVLAPAELSASATTPNPPTPSTKLLGVTSRLNVAPLIVDGTVRVYAAKHQVRADGPVTARAVYTARWSFRRWPEQLSAVVASGTTVITRWSDGKLVAIDARTGEVRWRADGPEAPGFAGHRTGAATVWDPPGLRLAAGTLLVTEGQTLSGYAASTGQSIWTATVPAGCVNGFTTSGDAYLCATGVYDATTGAALTGWPAGPYQPVGCETSNCDAFRDGAGQGWLATTAVPRRAPALDDPLATIVAGVVITAFHPDVSLPPPPPGVTPGPASGSSPSAPAGAVTSAPPVVPAGITSSTSAGVSPSAPAGAVLTDSIAVPPSVPAGAAPADVLPSVPAGTSPSSFFPAVAARTVEGAPLWTTSGPARVLGGESETVLLLTPENMLRGVDVRTGDLKYSMPLRFWPDREDTLDWKPGLYQVTDGFLAIERLNPDAPDDPESPIYYLATDAVLLIALPD
ncbi:PQQ-binding-like beta-propeller repeat protein [Actinoplanes philippinensis]|uniref:outer membrane protein assembly factor BamB family protein n=1 Tax=Actinoplanes philippinensis TaxID=35752 RepID=UPI0033E884CD